MSANATPPGGVPGSREHLTGPCGTYQVGYEEKTDTYWLQGPRSIAVNERLRSVGGRWNQGRKQWLVAGSRQTDLQKLLADIPGLLAGETPTRQRSSESHPAEVHRKAFDTALESLSGKQGKVEVRKVQNRTAPGKPPEPFLQLRFPRHEGANNWIRDRQFSWDGTGWILVWQRVPVAILPKLLADLNALLDQPETDHHGEATPDVDLTVDLTLIPPGIGKETLTVEIVQGRLRVEHGIDADDWIYLKPYAVYYRSSDSDQIFLEEINLIMYNEDADRAGWNYHPVVVEILTHMGYPVFYQGIPVTSQPELRQAVERIRQQEEEAARQSLLDLQNWSKQHNQQHQ